MSRADDLQAALDGLTDAETLIAAVPDLLVAFRALEHIASPNRQARLTARDAVDMALYARGAIATFNEGGP